MIGPEEGRPRPGPLAEEHTASSHTVTCPADPNGVPAFTGVGFKPDSQKGVLTQVGLILGHVLPLTSIYKHLPSVSFTSWPESVLPKRELPCL